MFDKAGHKNSRWYTLPAGRRGQQGGGGAAPCTVGCPTCGDFIIKPLDDN